MEFLLFIIAVLVIVVISQSSKQKKPDEYARGYWDGYRALGEKVTEQLNKGTIDAEELTEAVNVGVTGSQNITQDAGLLENLQTAEKIVDSDKSESLKREQSLRNSNLLLYMASFLLVAAGATFIGAALPDELKLFGLGILIALFYVVGLVLYDRATALRPAAVAFTGTGLALLPFFGVVLRIYGGSSPELAWFMTSILGLVLYIIAAVRLRNQVISYLSMAFIISLVCSSVSVIALPVIWYFVSIIGVSLVTSLLSFIRPKWLPAVFSEPIERTGQLATPLALVASLFAYNQLYIVGYEIVFAVATAHYLVTWLKSRERLYEDFVRGLGHVTALLFAWDFSAMDSTKFGLLFVAIAVIQGVISILSHQWSSRRRTHNEYWACVALVAQFVGLLFWIGTPDQTALVSLGLLILGITSSALYIVLKNVFFLVPMLLVTFVLPLQFGRLVLSPPLDWTWIEAYMLALAAGALYVFTKLPLHRSKDLLQLTICAFVGYAVIAFIASFMVGNHFIAAVVLVALTTLCALASRVYKQPEVTLASTIVGAFALAQVWLAFGVEDKWIPFAVAWSLATICYGLAQVAFASVDLKRYTILLYSSVGVLGLSSLYGLLGFYNNFSIVSAWTIVGLGCMLVAEGLQRNKATMTEKAIYVVVFGLLYALSISYTTIPVIVYGHIWAGVIVAIALWRKKYYPHAYVAAGFITASSALTAIDVGSGYTLVFLIEHLTLLVTGAIRAKSWAIWWGIIASSFAVLYFIRDIAYLAFGFLGLLLITFVVWRLNRQSSQSKLTKNSK